ncbi:hypothetical protein SAFG77S_12188 [Streptomyces afghaniensis]
MGERFLPEAYGRTAVSRALVGGRWFSQFSGYAEDGFRVPRGVLNSGVWQEESRVRRMWN